MSLIPEEKGSLIVAYSADDTFKALCKALDHKNSNLKIKSSDYPSHTLFVKACANWKTCGENLQIAIITSSNGFSEVKISSQSKFGLMDLGKNQENINTVLSLLTQELDGGKYSKVKASEVADIPDQIKKLSDLKESGILTAEEFASKKAALLARM